MKLKNLLILFIITICFGLGVNAEEIELRIGLFYGSTAKESVVISSEEGLETSLAEDLGTKFTATVLEGNVVLHNDEGDVPVYSGTDGKEVKAIARDKVVLIDGKKYRGNVVLRPSTDGKITVINEVMTEEYVKGVVAGEMPSGWPGEALKAQAVAARCFALNSLGKHENYGFDLCSTTNCQVYGGISSETEATNRAVEETAGKVLCYNNKIINTLFSSSNGGYAEASQNVWGGAYPYFKTFKDEYEKTDDISSAIWQVSYTPEEIKEELLKNGVDIGDITNMEVVKTSESGRVLEVKITGTKGTKSYTKSYARTFLGLKSQLYTITPPESSDIYCISAEGKSKISGSYHVLTAQGLEEKKVPGGSGKYIINGRGYGHGVGMSQWGAYYMSKQNLTYEDILTYYFKNTEVKSYTDIMS